MFNSGFLLDHAKVSVSLGAQADGTGTASGAILDMSGYDSVCFIAKFDDVDNGAGLTLQAQQNTANSASGMATLSGSATKTADATSGDDKVLALDIRRPRERYIRPQVVIADANATLAAIIAIQYNARELPVTQDSSVVDSDKLDRPAEA